jgi:hypothetical protein
MARKKTKQEAPRFPRVIETFVDPGWSFGIREPSCVNQVSIRKYRVTIEQIQEPIEVLQERLLHLWRHTNNHHEKRHLEEEATLLDYKLPAEEFGVNAPKRSY